jgi:hypothetical protein
MAEHLKDKQRRFIAALLTEPTVEAAADAVGIGRRTAWTWLADRTFREAYTEASRARLDATVGRLRALASEAVDTLRLALTDDRTSNRVRAAIALLDLTVKIELDELARRIEALEAGQAGRSQ